MSEDVLGSPLPLMKALGSRHLHGKQNCLNSTLNFQMQFLLRWFPWNTFGEFGYMLPCYHVLFYSCSVSCAKQKVVRPAKNMLEHFEV